MFYSETFRVDIICFKLINNQIESFIKNQFLSNYNIFWVLQNRNLIIYKLNKINKRKENAKSFFSYGFSTVYTKLPHDKLFDVLFLLINFAFQGHNKSFFNLREC